MNQSPLKQKASPYLVMFVLGCTVIITGLLYIMQSAEAKAQQLSPDEYVSEYLK